MPGLGYALAGAIGGIGEGIVEEANARREMALEKLRRQWDVEDREADQRFRADQAEIEHGRAVDRLGIAHGYRQDETRSKWERDDAHARRAGRVLAGGGGGGRGLDPSKVQAPTEQAMIAQGVVEAAQALEMDPLDLATIISYETGGTFDPGQKGGAGGRHRGLIQFGEEEVRTYGVDPEDPMSQLGPEGAIVRYYTDRGWQPGMSFEDAYSTVNAGRPGRPNASDAANGGMPGTVRDKVNSKEMAEHRENARRWLAEAYGEEAVAGGGEYDPREAAEVFAHPDTPDDVRDALARRGGLMPAAATEWEGTVWARDEEGNVVRAGTNVGTGQFEPLPSEGGLTYYREEGVDISASNGRYLEDIFTDDVSETVDWGNVRAAKSEAMRLMDEEGLSEDQAIEKALGAAVFEEETTVGEGWFDGPERTKTARNREGRGRIVDFEYGETPEPPPPPRPGTASAAPPPPTGEVDPEAVLAEARDAVARGADRAAVEDRLRSLGIDPGLL